MKSKSTLVSMQRFKSFPCRKIYTLNIVTFTVLFPQIVRRKRKPQISFWGEVKFCATERDNGNDQFLIRCFIIGNICTPWHKIAANLMLPKRRLDFYIYLKLSLKNFIFKLFETCCWEFLVLKFFSWNNIIATSEINTERPQGLKRPYI